MAKWTEEIPEWISEYPEWIEGESETPQWLDCGWAEFNPIWIGGPSCTAEPVPFGRVTTKQKQQDEQLLLKKRILNDDKEVLEILVNFILSSGV